MEKRENLIKMRKALTATILAGAVSLNGCGTKQVNNTKISNVVAPITTQLHVEKPDQEETKEVLNDITLEEVTSKKTVSKPELLEYIRKSSFDKTTKSILKDMVLTSTSDYILENIFDICTKEYNSVIESSLCCTISHAAEELYKKNNQEENDYKEEKIKIFDNLENSAYEIPNQMYMFYQLANYGDIKIYESFNVLNEQGTCNIITNQDDKVLAFNLNNIILIKLESKNLYLANLNEYTQIKPTYTFAEIQKIATDVSKRRMNYEDTELIPTSDIAIINVLGNISYKRNTSDIYHFIRLNCPYTFGEDNYVYSDILNDKVSVTVSKYNTVEYVNPDTDEAIYDIDMANISDTSSTSTILTSFHDFALLNGIELKEYMTKDEIENICKNASKYQNIVENNFYRVPIENISHTINR